MIRLAFFVICVYLNVQCYHVKNFKKHRKIFFTQRKNVHCIRNSSKNIGICRTRRNLFAAEGQNSWLEYQALSRTPPDLASSLLKERIIYLGMPISTQISQLIVAQLLFLDSESSSQDIKLYINSPGSVEVGAYYSELNALAIVDVINYIQAPVQTVCVGQALGTAALLLSCGKKGSRFSLPRATILLKEPQQHFEIAQSSDLVVASRELLFIRDRIITEFAKVTFRSYEAVKQDVMRHTYMSPESALKYGIIDKIMS